MPVGETGRNGLCQTTAAFRIPDSLLSGRICYEIRFYQATGHFWVSGDGKIAIYDSIAFDVRRLNFGHTLGHGIESLHEENGLLHGECVALGMIPMCAPDVRQRLIPVLERLGLPTACDADPDRVMAAVAHDKKAGNGTITAVIVEKAGSCRMTEMTPEELKARYTALLRK